MKSKSKSSRVLDRYGMIEALESRIAPAAVTVQLPANPTFVTVTVGGSLLVKAGEVLTTGSAGGGSYLLYVAAGQVLVHTTDLNHDGTVNFNEITGLSVGNGAVIVSFVDIHGDVVTDLNPDGTLTHGGLGDVLLDNNIAEIDLRSLNDSDFAGTVSQTPAQLVNAHLAMSNYSIFGNIYAGAGLGLANNPNSGLLIDTTGENLQGGKFNSGDNKYQAVIPIIGSIYAGTAASGQSFSFGSSGQGIGVKGASPVDVFGNLLAFNPAPGEAGASIYNISTVTTGEAFSIGTIQAGNGGYNAAGGNIGNVALFGDNAGTYKLIAGNAGTGTIGQPGGSILNFSEGGTFISEVLLQSGNGGIGLTGAGGVAGSIQFNPAAPIQVNAHFTLNYGSGGNGYTAGGAGGGTPSGTFVTPAGVLTTAIDVVTTMHTSGSIGSHQSFDFDGDGYSDAVFSTNNPNQVVVALSGGNAKVSGYGFESPYASFIYLNSPAQVDSIVVGNFTDTFNPVTHQPEEDIAVACGNASYAGVEVYLSEYNAKTGAFEGFSDPLFSPLPALTANFYYSSTPITKILAGDFLGKGTLDLAVLAQEYPQGNTGADSVLIFLNPETNAAHPGGSGYFYANFANGNTPTINLGPALNPTNSIFEVTALKSYTPTVPGSNTSNGHDIIVEAGLGATKFNIISDLGGSPGMTATYAFGKVDTNRNVATSNNPNFSPTQFTVLGIAVTQDINNPKIADIAVLSQAPVAFLEIFQGTGVATGFTVGTGLNVDQAGVYFGNPNSGPVAIVAVPNTTGTMYSDVGILDYTIPGGDIIYVLNLTERPTPLVASAMMATANQAEGVTATGVRSGTEAYGTITPLNGKNNALVAFDTFDPFPNGNASFGSPTGSYQFGFLTADPLSSYEDFQGIQVTEPNGGTQDIDFKTAGYYFIAGNGGDSESGPGGAGGSLGQSLTINGTGAGATATGTLSVEFPTNADYGGAVYFVGGNGGNGFAAGGAGGSLVGISATYPVRLETSDVLLLAGNGGESLTGAGGAGGSLSQLFIESGSYFQGGSGGIGVVGGSGGALLGNTQASLLTNTTNNLEAYVTLQGGNGATGIIGGGSGGAINSFVNQFNALEFGVGGSLSYTAGNAGNAVAGQAGTGGSIINCSPSVFDNNLVGPISLQGGTGGTGLYGGSGGSVTNFVQVSTITDIPTLFSVFGGFGGSATLGVGGSGGSISGVDIAATGSGGNFNRLIAGPGGSSSGGVGGAGGSVSNVDTSSVGANAQNVIAAGAGGDGFTAGGAGGSVLDASADAGSTTGKVLIIAGDGGTSSSVKALAGSNAIQTAANIANSIGGVNGPGGAGGSIENFTQSLSVNTDVDLIAGNGGATLNHSVAAGNATVDNSGMGGSVINISIAGSIGNSATGVAIKSYNNLFAGQTMQDFVNTYIVGDQGPLSDTVGNVGLVAGAAGRVENGLPSANGVSGSVSNVHAENIMSMVAGNVDQVDLIQSLTDYGVTIAGGILGANKTVFYNTVTGKDDTTVAGGVTLKLGDLNYINIYGAEVTTPLPGGGELVDGAFLAKNIRTIQSPRDFQGTESS